MSDLVRNPEDRFSHEAHIEKFKPLASFHTPKTEFIMMKLILTLNLSLVLRKTVLGYPTRSDTNLAVQSQKMTRGLKFRI